MTTDTDHAAPTTLSVLPTHEMQRLPWTPVPVRPAVDEKTLWQLGDFVVALVTDSPGSSSPGQGDLVAQHHLGVVSGPARWPGDGSKQAPTSTLLPAPSKRSARSAPRAAG
jgi:hypothetical protein